MYRKAYQVRNYELKICDHSKHSDATVPEGDWRA